jgi:hypothetical protein
MFFDYMYLFVVNFGYIVLFKFLEKSGENGGNQSKSEEDRMKISPLCIVTA